MKPLCRRGKTQTGCPTRIPSGFYAADCPNLALFPPQRRKALHESLLHEILEQRVVSSRGLQKRRGVKRNQTKFPVIRARDKPKRFDFTIRIEVLK